jgi:ElaB/YqjD/DUF883 family membrane-anchored ribosome-binding protein
MNPPSETPEQIRSEIDSTRRRMDDTLDALSERFRGRHLLDEIVGFFRSENAQTSELRHKLSNTVKTTADSVVNTVKANPIPLLLVGAGVGWMIYENRRKHAERFDFSSRFEDDDELYPEAARNYSDPDALYDRPLDYPSSSSVESGDEANYEGAESTESAREASGKLSEAKNKIVEKAAHAREQMKETFSHVSDRVREKSQAVSARTREAYSRGRERVATTTREHPLEVGLVCLALGVAVGLALPTPEKARQLAGPTVDRLRERTRKAGSELLDKGQRIAEAAAAAARDEARAQGLAFPTAPTQPEAQSTTQASESSASNPPVAT